MHKEDSDSTSAAVENAQEKENYEEAKLSDDGERASSVGISISYEREIILKEKNSSPREYVKLWYSPLNVKSSDTGTCSS